ncbi:MAG: hypothetical protein AAFY60_08030 [Myxococcota bacterium]
MTSALACFLLSGALSTAVHPESLELEVQKNELVSVISILPRPGDEADGVRDRYLKRAFELAGPFGLRPLGSFAVQAAPLGDFEPKAVSIFAWKSVEAEAAFAASKQWPPIKALRPAGWTELRIHDASAPTATQISFRSDRTYGLLTVWDSVALSTVERAINNSGVRIVYRQDAPGFSALAQPGRAPALLAFVESRTLNDFSAFARSLGSHDTELLQLTPNFPKKK